MRLPLERELCALMAACAGLGCSLIYDLSPDQCGTSADCESSFGANYVCEEGMCKPGGGGGSGAAGNCQTTADCRDRDPDLFPVQPSACIQDDPNDESTRDCVPLKTAECPVLLPNIVQDKWLENLLGESPIILGAFAPFPPDTQISDYIRAYDLAFTEFSQVQVGFPGPGTQLRPPVMVVCNSTPGDTAVIEAGIDHLVKELKVPGLISTLNSDDLRNAFAHVEGPAAEVLFMSPIEIDSSLATVPDSNLMWHLLPGGEYVALPYRPLLTRTIEYVHNEEGVPVGDPIKVALVTASDQRFLADLADKIRLDIEFNDTDFFENLDAGNAINLTVDSWLLDPEAPLTDQSQAILDFAPHIVIALTAPELFTRIIPTVENNWTTVVTTGQAKPFYLISPYNYNNGSFLRQVLTDFPTLRNRMAGVNWASTTEEYEHILRTFELAWDSELPERAGTRGYENYYDAAYYLMYGVAAGGSTLGRFNGFDIRDGLRRVSGGSQDFEVGRRDLPAALGALASPSAFITLNGTLGAPNFDSATDARTDPGSVWCVSDNAGTQLVDVLRYDSTTGELVGDFPCNPNF
jgi:hypothetical protein